MDVWNMIERIESILRERNITKGAFYAGCSITDGAYSQWKNRRSNPSKRSIEKISNFLDVPVEYLLHGTGPKRKLTTVSDDELSVDQKTLLTMYRSLPDDVKAKALAGFADFVKNLENK